MRKNLLGPFLLRGERVSSSGSISSSQSTNENGKQGNHNATFATIEDCSTSSSVATSGGTYALNTNKRAGSRRFIAAGAARSSLSLTTSPLANVSKERNKSNFTQQQQRTASIVTDAGSKKATMTRSITYDSLPSLQDPVRHRPPKNSIARLSPTSKKATMTRSITYESLRHRPPKNSIARLSPTSSSRVGSKPSQLTSLGDTRALVNNSRFLTFDSTLDLMDEYERISALDEDDDKNGAVVQLEEVPLDLESHAPSPSSYNTSSNQARSAFAVRDDFFSRYEEIISACDENYDNEATQECHGVGYDPLSRKPTSVINIGGCHPSQGVVNHGSVTGFRAGGGRRSSMCGLQSCSSFGVDSFEAGSRRAETSLARDHKRAPRRCRRSSMD